MLDLEFESLTLERSFRGTEAPLESFKNCEIIERRERKNIIEGNAAGSVAGKTKQNSGQCLAATMVWWAEDHRE